MTKEKDAKSSRSMTSSSLKSAVLPQLRALLGERATDSAAVVREHGRSEAYHAAHPPDLVCFPQTTQEVAQIVRICAAHGMPIVPFGAGTSLEGNVAAIRGGVCIAFAQMKRVLAINTEDMDCRVQPGITRKELNAELRGTGLFFPLDPGADASIGGMASTRAAGTMGVRYGTMRDNVLALEVVLADGRVIRTSRRARKSAAGYDLTRLFVGAEGTLGVITEVALRLHPLPEAMSAAVCPFETFKGGRHRDRGDPTRHPRGAHGAARRGDDPRGSIFTPSSARPKSRRFSSNSTAARMRSSNRPRPHRRSRASTARSISTRRRGRRSAAACGTRAITRSTPARDCARAPKR
jgi:FAD/FMN-containing dehydrogenase